MKKESKSTTKESRTETITILLNVLAEKITNLEGVFEDNKKKLLSKKDETESHFKKQNDETFIKNDDNKDNDVEKILNSKIFFISII